MTRPPIVRLLLALAVLLATPATGAAQARVQALELRAHRAPSPSLAPPAVDAEAEAQVGRAGRIGRFTLAGAAIGAAAGLATYTVLEQTIEHRDHSEDSLMLLTLTVPATFAGALIGLIVGATTGG